MYDRRLSLDVDLALVRPTEISWKYDWSRVATVDGPVVPSLATGDVTKREAWRKWIIKKWAEEVEVGEY